MTTTTRISVVSVITVALAVLLAVLVASPGKHLADHLDSDSLPGDFNGNGCIDREDIEPFDEIVLEPDRWTDADRAIVDLSGDGALSSADTDILKSRIGECSAGRLTAADPDHSQAEIDPSSFVTLDIADQTVIGRVGDWDLKGGARIAFRTMQGSTLDSSGRIPLGMTFGPADYAVAQLNGTTAPTTLEQLADGSSVIVVVHRENIPAQAELQIAALRLPAPSNAEQAPASQALTVEGGEALILSAVSDSIAGGHIIAAAAAIDCSAGRAFSTAAPEACGVAANCANASDPVQSGCINTCPGGAGYVHPPSQCTDSNCRCVTYPDNGQNHINCSGAVWSCADPGSLHTEPDAD